MFYIVEVFVVLGLAAADQEIVTPSTILTGDNLAFTRGCWQQNVIPFYIGSDFTQDQIAFIYKMIAVFHDATCLRWAEYAYPAEKENSTALAVSDSQVQHTPANYVDFSKVYDGRCRTTRILRDNNTFVAYIKLLDHCFTQNAVMHEIMHALGFHHEQQRSDRNCYVSVVRAAENLPNYRIQPHEPWIERYPYDKYSVLHYTRSHLMQSRKQRRKGRPPTDFLGNSKGELTHLDLSKILYKFCGKPHYCDVSPYDCKVAADWRSRRGCVRWS